MMRTRNRSSQVGRGLRRPNWTGATQPPNEPPAATDAGFLPETYAVFFGKRYGPPGARPSANPGQHLPCRRLNWEHGRQRRSPRSATGN